MLWHFVSLSNSILPLRFCSVDILNILELDGQLQMTHCIIVTSLWNYWVEIGTIRALLNIRLVLNCCHIWVICKQINQANLWHQLVIRDGGNHVFKLGSQRRQLRLFQSFLQLQKNKHLQFNVSTPATNWFCPRWMFPEQIFQQISNWAVLLSHTNTSACPRVPQTFSVDYSHWNLEVVITKNVFDSDHSCFTPTLIIDREPFHFNKAVISQEFI